MGLWCSFYNRSHHVAILGELVGISILATLWYARRIFCSYLVPFFGVTQVVYAAISAFVYHKATQLSGPIGIGATVVHTSHTAVMGIIMAAVVSLFLAASSMLPLPVLDGGNILLVILRKYRPAWEKKIYLVGAIGLLALVLFLCVNDLKNLL